MLAFVGPTASGKSEVGLEVAARHGGEIISVDSMQVYRGMDIGTAKATSVERDRVPHHLVDLVDPEHGFSVAEFQHAGRRAMDEIAARDAPAVVVGGSGLHFRSLVDSLDFPPSDPAVRREMEDLDPGVAVKALLTADPDAGNVVDLANHRRVVRALEVHRVTGQTPSQRHATPAAVAVREYRSRVPLVVIGLDPGPDLAGRVERRFDRMLEVGLLDEVERLAPRLGVTAAQAVGYKQLLGVVHGERNIDQGRRDAIDATRALAGRQRTFFGRDPRIRWLEWDDDPDVRVDRAVGILEEVRWTS